MKKDYTGLKNSLTFEQTLSIIELMSNKAQKKSRIDIAFCCPLHDDNTASASYSFNRKKWKCFTCDEDVCGDIFDLVKHSKGLRFQAEAYDCIMAIIGGIGEVNKEHRFKPLTVNEASNTAKAKIEFNTKFLNFCYEASWNGPKYLINRGFSQALIEEFECGTHRDFYYAGERLTIPAHDEDGNIIGVIGRTLSNHADKYRYTKGLKVSENLFNLHKAKKNDYVIITEGPLDAMRLHSFGYSTVSIFGCNLSAVQASLLKKYFKKVYIALDNDEAGHQGQTNALSMLYSMGVDAKVLSLATYKDVGEITDANEFTKIFNAHVAPVKRQQRSTKAPVKKTKYQEQNEIFEKAREAMEIDILMMEDEMINRITEEIEQNAMQVQ